MATLRKKMGKGKAGHRLTFRGATWWREAVPFGLCVLLAAGGKLSGAAELVTLKSGFTIEARSHQIRDTTLILTTATGTLELPASELVDLQILQDTAAPDSPLAATPEITVALSPEKALASAAAAQGLIPELVRSVAKVESNLKPNAVSVKGAMGLMQLMPGTAAQLGVNSTDMLDNALGGAKYLRELLLQYKGDAALALAAYNAGPNAVAKYGGVPPYSETRQYVVKVLQELARERAKQPQTKTAKSDAEIASSNHP